MEAPGPGLFKTLRDLWDMRRDPIAPFVRRAARYGPITRARIPGINLYTVFRPQHVEHVLVANQDNYLKGPEYELMATSLGSGLVTSSGELWRKQRRLIQPLFAKRHLEPLAEQMTAAGASLLDDWDAREVRELDVAAAMMGLTLDVVGRALFGEAIFGETTRTIGVVMTDALHETTAASRSPIVWAAYALPGMTIARALRLRPLGQRRLRMRLAELDAIVATMIDGHRREPRDDLLSLLLESRDAETGEPMSDRQVRDEVVTFLAAGHETTASALSWMWWLLAGHPEARERMYAEVDGLLGGRTPTFADADRLPFTRAVVSETLRLYPPVWMVMRRAAAEDVIDGVRIPAGATVAVAIYLTHHDPDVWPEPEAFVPERFLGDHEHPRHALVPFSAGRRVCVGNTFALTEATLLAAMIAQRYVLDADPGRRVEREPLVTLRPRGGLPMHLRRRAALRTAPEPAHA
jgi:cytochrome P450